MQLKRGETAYVVQEYVVDTSVYADAGSAILSNGWNASMEGYEEKTDAIVQMARHGDTPTAALDNLIKAMAEAGIRT